MKYLITIFSIVIASFILSEHLINYKINDEFKYDKKDYFTLTFIFSIFVWGLFLISLFTNCELPLNIAYIFIIKCINKISYYNKKFKIILDTNAYNENVQLIKGYMIKDAIKNLFYILATPCICLKKILDFILDKLF